MNINQALDAQIVELDERRGEILLGNVFAFLRRFVAYPSEHAHVAHALWIFHAHLMDKWDSTPRIAFLSAEPASGKSRALTLTELLVPRPVCSVNVTPAYLFRKVGSEDGRPTILFDEIDTVFGPKAKENEEIRGLLNAGYQRGATAGRCVMRGKIVETEEIPAYCAVALAGLGWLPETILTRSIVIRMRRRRSDEQIEQFRSRINRPGGHALREQIATWAAAQTDDIVWPEMPPEIQDRNAEVWEALLAVADLVGGEWPARARVAAIALLAGAEDAEPSLGVRLLADARMIYGTDRQFISTGELLAELHKMEDSPWADLHGKPLDARGLAKRLRQHGIKPKQGRVDAHTTLKGYERAAFEDEWLRYLPPQPATSETKETPETRARVSLVSDVSHSAANGGGDHRPAPPWDDDDSRWIAEGRSHD